MSGWIALSFLKDPILAEEHFKRFYNNVGYPISLSRGAYWLGRTYEKMGNKESFGKMVQRRCKISNYLLWSIVSLKNLSNRKICVNESNTSR